MPSVFDEVDAPKKSVFDDEISPKPKRSVFDEEEAQPPRLGETFSFPKVLDPIDPLGDLGIPNPSGRETLMSPLTMAGDIVRGGVADVAAGLSALKRPTGTETMGSNLQEASRRSGNLPAVLMGEELPIDTTLADISKEAPAEATLGKISQGVAASLPLIAVMPQGALGKLVSAGFTADMINHAGPEATALGEELGKPPEERDYDKITSSLSSLIQTSAFAPLAGAHAAGKPIQKVVDLAKSLKTEPLEGGPNAIQPKAAQPVRSVFDEPIQSQGEVPGEVAGGKADVGGGKESATQEKALSGEEIANLLGAEFRGTAGRNGELMQFEAKKPDGTASTSFSVKAGSTPEQVMAKYQEVIERYKDDPENAPRPAPSQKSPAQSIMEMTPDEFAKWKSEVKYGEQTAQDIADKLTPEEAAKVRAEATRLGEQTVAVAKEMENRPNDEAKLNALQDSIKLSAKAQTLREIAENYERSNKPSSVKPSEAVAPEPLLEAPAPSVNNPPTLTDIYKIFEPEKKAGTSLKQKGINLVEGLRTGISSKFRPINKLAEDIAKAYGQTSSKDIAGIMEQLKGSQGKAEADIYRFDRDVSKLVKGGEKDFNAYVFLRRSIDRLNQDAADIAKAQAGGNVPQLNRRAVANYTLNDLNPKLQALEQKIGPEKLKQFQQAADSYQAHLDQALRLQVESGRMSQEVYDNIKKGNQFYAPFKVMKYIEESMKPQGAGPRIDTTADYTKAMKGIEDPDFKLGDLLAAARQSISMSRILADKNNAMRSVAELAATDTRGDFIKKLGPDEEAPKGMEAVNVIENGKKNRYAVDEDVAAAVQIYGGNAGGVLVRALANMSIPFRAGATALNLPFQVSNFLADIPRQGLVSKYGVRGVNDLWRYPAEFVESLFSSISGDVFGKKSFDFSNPQDTAIQQLAPDAKNLFPKNEQRLFLDFLDSGVAGTTVQEHLTPEALKFKEPTSVSKSKQALSTVLNIVPDFAKAIEQTSKILGVKRAMRFEGVQSGKELAKQIPEAVTELRRFSGSPDFGRQGKAIEDARLNLLYMFLNARIQGAVADIGRLSGRDGAATAGKTWRNLAIAVGIPTAYLYYLNNSDEYKDDFAKRPLQEKQNYWLIPKDSFITNDDGEKIRDFWRIPKRESSKWIANFTESALNFAGKRDPQSAKDFGASMVQELMPVNIQGENAQERLESVASGLNPMIKAPLELASGRDLYRHRTIVPDSMKNASPEQQYTPRTAEAFKKLAVAMPDVAPEFLRNPLILENLTKNLTAGLITQFLPRKPVEGRSGVENNPLLARFQGLPYTDNAAFKEEMQNLEREAADEQLARHRAATKILDENPKADLSTMAAKANGDVKLINHLADLYVARQNGITAQERQLLSLPARQRAMYVADQIQGLNPGDRENKIMELARKRILTEAVLQELPEFIKQ